MSSVEVNFKGYYRKMLNSSEDLSHLTREERRKFLKDKRRNNKDGNACNAMRQKVKDDPAGALLSMGVDDVALLANAKALLKNPHSALTNMKSILCKASACVPATVK